MSRKTKDSLGLAAAFGKARGCALETGEALPRRLVQLSEDLDRRLFHVTKLAHMCEWVKRGYGGADFPSVPQ